MGELSVLKFFDPNGNDRLSELSGRDLQELIVSIDECYIQLRNSLGFEPDVTFGVELEFERAMKHRIDKKLSESFPNGDWKIKDDLSLNFGAEINSPILRDNETSWMNLDKICSIIEPYASIGKNAGGHIHIGTQTLGDKEESWLNFIKMWSVYENIIYRFVYGDFLTARPSMLKFAQPIARELWWDYERLKASDASLYRIISTISYRRRQAVNFYNVSYDNYREVENGNTIEFRCPNGSLDSAIWQNNINLFVKMLLYCRSTSFNDDLVQQRRQLISNKFAGLNGSETLELYDEIYLEQALELCDMIFTNNLDKIYFLRQYLKSFELCKKKTSYPKSHTLTKKRKV